MDVKRGDFLKMKDEFSYLNGRGGDIWRVSRADEGPSPMGPGWPLYAHLDQVSGACRWQLRINELDEYFDPMPPINEEAKPEEKNMMEDKDLLELAAKAAGYDVVWNEYWGCFQHRNPLPDQFGALRHPWIPLADDGDALRLAVKLGLQVYGRNIGGSVDDLVFVDEADCGHNPYAATRRAIVLRAAEIGAAKP